jgi:transposase
MSTKSIKLNKKELKYIPVLEEVMEGNVSQVAAAVKLNISRRQVIRLIARFREGGAANIAHRGRNKRSPRALPEEKANEILSLIKMHYSDHNSVAAAQLLQHDHGITIHPERLRRLLIARNYRHVKKRSRIG